MKIGITILLLVVLHWQIASADKLQVGMSLQSAEKLLEESGAQKELHAYHFPWTSNFVEVKVLDGETSEQTEARIESELSNVSGKNGYSVFYTLKNETRLELVLEVDDDVKVIHSMRVGEPTVEYKNKFEWIAARKNGKLRVVISFDTLSNN